MSLIQVLIGFSLFPYQSFSLEPLVSSKFPAEVLYDWFQFYCRWKVFCLKTSGAEILTTRHPCFFRNAMLSLLLSRHWELASLRCPASEKMTIKGWQRRSVIMRLVHKIFKPQPDDFAVVSLHLCKLLKISIFQHCAGSFPYCCLGCCFITWWATR